VLAWLAMVTADTELHIQLRDGTRARIRPIRPDDKARLQSGVMRLSPHSRYLRFNAPVDRLTADQLRYLTEIDYHDHMAWVALDEDVPEDGGMGVARYIRLAEDPTVAEAAVTVMDEYQGRGLGTVLLGILGRSAVEAGITTFRNYVLAGNAVMLEIFEELRATVEDAGAGLLRVDYPIPADPSDLPDTPVGRVIRTVATHPITLTFGPPLWIEDERGENEVGSPDLANWLDAMFPEDGDG
jgi:GNAT superfamily N-acetyltransferase